MCAFPTLPKIFRPITQNTLIFLFGLWQNTVSNSDSLLHNMHKMFSSIVCCYLYPQNNFRTVMSVCLLSKSCLKAKKLFPNSIL